MGHGQLQDGAGSRLRKAHPQGLALNLTQTKLGSINKKTVICRAPDYRRFKQCCHDKTMKPATPMATQLRDLKNRAGWLCWLFGLSILYVNKFTGQHPYRLANTHHPLTGSIIVIAFRRGDDRMYAAFKQICKSTSTKAFASDLDFAHSR